MNSEAYTTGDPAFHAHVEARIAAAPAPAAAPPPVAPFKSREELLDARQDPRWHTDAAYRDEWRQRVAAMGEELASPVVENRVQHIRFDGEGGWVDVNAEQEARLREQHHAEIARRLPVHVAGVGEVLPITSQAELVQLMSSQDYEMDETFRELVQLRLSVSTAF